MKKLIGWISWLFRRGKRSSLVLNISPADSVIGMMQYRQYLCITTKLGELYMLDGDRLVEFSEATFERVDPSEIPAKREGSAE